MPVRHSQVGKNNVARGFAADRQFGCRPEIDRSQKAGPGFPLSLRRDLIGNDGTCGILIDGLCRVSVRKRRSIYAQPRPALAELYLVVVSKAGLGAYAHAVNIRAVKAFIIGYLESG